MQQQLVSFNAIPEFNNYLAYIFASLREQPGAVRQMAGLARARRVGRRAQSDSPLPLRLEATSRRRQAVPAQQGMQTIKNKK